MVKRWAGASSVVLAVLLGTTGVATAGPVQPVLECVWSTGQGTTIALWGYDNEESASVEFEIGGKNEIKPSPEDRGQPTVFAPGEHRGVFVSEHDEASKFEWKVDGEEVKVDLEKDSVRQCANQPLPSSGPLLPVLVLPAGVGLVGFGGVALAAARRGRGTQGDVS